VPGHSTAQPQHRSEPVDPQRWLEEHGDALYAYALAHTRNRDTAEDLVQETLLSALRAHDRFESGSAVRTWLIGILKHKIADHFRRRSRERQALGDRAAANEAFAAGLFAPDGRWLDVPKRWRSEPADAVDRDELREALRQCLDRLSPTLADAFCLREMSGLDGRTLCDVLNVSESALWTQLHRARVLLRKCLERYWFAPEKKRR
jgi:RNA polymerase sigma-70 factor (TIGR02943 family)